MIGGIPGTFHHLYFAGTTTPITAIGAMFSALEVVPLVLLGYDAFENWTVQHKAIWMKPMAAAAMVNRISRLLSPGARRAR